MADLLSNDRWGERVNESLRVLHAAAESVTKGRRDAENRCAGVLRELETRLERDLSSIDGSLRDLDSKHNQQRGAAEASFSDGERRRKQEAESKISGIEKDVRQALAKLDNEAAHLSPTVPQRKGWWIFSHPNPEYDRRMLAIEAERNRVRQDSEMRRKDVLRQLVELENADRDRVRKEREVASQEVAKSKQDVMAERKILEQSIRAKIDEAKAQRRLSLDSELKGLQQRWEGTQEQFRKSLSEVRGVYPRLSDLRTSGYRLGEPSASIPLGSMAFEFSGLSYGVRVPALVPFPLMRNLYFPAPPQSREPSVSMIRGLMLRHLYHAAGRMRLVLCDPQELGHTFKPFLPLLGVNDVFPHGKILSTGDEIEKALEAESARIEDVIQQRLASRYQDVMEFNAANPKDVVPYTLLVIADAPHQLTQKAIGWLERILRHGNRCGVASVLLVDEHSIGDREKLTWTNIRAGMEVFTQDEGRWQAQGSLLKSYTDLRGAFDSEPMPAEDVTSATIADMIETWKKSRESRYAVTFEDLLATNCTWDGHSSATGLAVPLGLDERGDVVELSLGQGTAHHVLVGGRSGSGKSNLLNVAILGLVNKYAPEELDLYLLDFKESVEFNDYATPLIPHIRVVATETDREFGAAILGRLVQECKDRARILKEASVSTISQYADTLDRRLPRILLVIDEFQVLFQPDDETAQTARDHLSYLARQGRAFGVHLLLATQTFKGISSNQIRELESQIGVRVALACSEEDSRQILGEGNPLARDLTSPPQAIYNAQNGQPSGNVLVRVPFCAPAMRRLQLAELARRRPEGNRADSIVFRGQRLPNLHDSTLMHRHLKTARGQSVPMDIMVGESIGLDKGISFPLSRQAGRNVLVIGRNDRVRQAMVTSIALCASRHPDCAVWLCDAEGSLPSVDRIMPSTEGGTQMRPINPSELRDVVQKLARRVRGEDPKADPASIILVLHGIHRISGLKPDRFAVASDKKADTLAKDFDVLLNDGPAAGVFIVCISDGWHRADEAMDFRSRLRHFDVRILFDLPKEDFNDMGVRIRTSLGEFKALLIDSASNRQESFWPFAAPADVATINAGDKGTMQSASQNKGDNHEQSR